MTLAELQAEIAKSRKDRAIAAALAEHEHDRPTFGVTSSGLVLVNPAFVEKIGVKKMLRLIRAELKLAEELRKRVAFME